MAKIFRVAVAVFLLILLGLGAWLYGEIRARVIISDWAINATSVGRHIDEAKIKTPLNAAEEIINQVYFNGRVKTHGVLCPSVPNTFKSSQSGPAVFLATKVASEIQMPRTFYDQINRLVIACRLETKYSHSVLLRLWMATAYYGDGDVGAEAASAKLFGKPVAELNQDEALVLAALLWMPGYRNSPEALQRRVDAFRPKLEAPANQRRNC